MYMYIELSSPVDLYMCVGFVCGGMELKFNILQRHENLSCLSSRGPYPTNMWRLWVWALWCSSGLHLLKLASIVQPIT